LFLSVWWNDRLYPRISRFDKLLIVYKSVSFALIINFIIECISVLAFYFVYQQILALVYAMLEFINLNMYKQFPIYMLIEKKILILIINVIKKRNIVHLINESKGSNPFCLKNSKISPLNNIHLFKFDKNR